MNVSRAEIIICNKVDHEQFHLTVPNEFVAVVDLFFDVLSHRLSSIWCVYTVSSRLENDDTLTEKKM